MVGPVHHDIIRLAEGFSQHGKTFGDGGFVVFIPLKFERDIAAEVVLAHNCRDARIIQIEGVPQAAAIVHLGVHKDGLRGALFELVVWVFEEIACVEQDLQPRRIDSVDDSQKALRCSCQAPMVFQSKDYARPLSRGQTSFDTVNDPFETIIFGAAGQGLFDAAILHQIVEVPACAPCPRIEAYERDAELISKLDALYSVVDILSSLGSVR